MRDQHRADELPLPEVRLKKISLKLENRDAADRVRSVQLHTRAHRCERHRQVKEGNATRDRSSHSREVLHLQGPYLPERIADAREPPLVECRAPLETR